MEFDKTMVNDSDLINKVESLGEGMYKVPESKVVCKKDCDKEEKSEPSANHSSSSNEDPLDGNVSSQGFQLPNIYELINGLIR